jgi:hypothetical protein
MEWPRLLAYITGTVDQELLLRNEYPAAENRILKAEIKTRPHLSDAERSTLAEIGHRLGRKALEEVAAVANQTRFWAGIGSSLPTSSMDRRCVNPWADLAHVCGFLGGGCLETRMKSGGETCWAEFHRGTHHE